MKNNRLKKAFLSSLSSAMYQVIVIICGFVTAKLIIETYGSSWNGILTSIAKFLSLFSIVEMGISGSTRVALYKSLAENDTKKTSAIIKANDEYYRRISLFLIVYVVALSLLIPNIVNSEKEKSLIALMVIIIGLGSFAENCWGINSKILLMANQSRYVVNFAQTIATIANAILLVVIVLCGGSIFTSKLGSSVVYSIVPIALFVITRRMFQIDKNVEPDRSALRGRWDVLANSLSNIVNENVDVLFLTVLCDSTELSVYSLYYAVAGGLTKIFQIIINGIEAGFGNMWVKGEIETLKRNLRLFEFIMYSLAAILFGCMMVLIVPFMAVYMQGVNDVNYQRYALGITIGISQILMSIRTPYVLLVQAAGHYKQVKIGAYLEAIVNIILTFVLITKFGIIGAIIGTIVANGFRTLQYGWYASKHMINRDFVVIIKRLIWLLGMLVTSIFMSSIALNYIVIFNLQTWIISAIITFIIHTVVVMIFSFIFYRSDLIDFFVMAKRLVKR